MQELKAGGASILTFEKISRVGDGSGVVGSHLDTPSLVTDNDCRRTNEEF